MYLALRHPHGFCLRSAALRQKTFAARPHLEGQIHVGPKPVSLYDFEHSASWLQEVGVGKVAGVHRNEDTCAGNDLQLLFQGCTGGELHHSDLTQDSFVRAGRLGFYKDTSKT